MPLNLWQKIALREYKAVLKEREETGCCEGCKTGTADCDVNPLRAGMTVEQINAEIARLEALDV